MQDAGRAIDRRLVLAAALALPAMTANAAPAEKTVLHQEADFSQPPHRIYELLLDEHQFSAMTGPPARIARGEGGAISLFGGVIVGRNVELVPGRRVVQAWRDKAWEPGVYSLVKFELVPRGRGTHLMLDQTGYPPGEYHSLSIGWPSHYWQPMQKFLLSAPLPK